jgi:hypothetical protein
MTISPAMPLAAALESCAAELAALGEICAGLQESLSPLLLRAADVEKVQALDLVTQSLDALSSYLGAVATEAPAGAEVDAEAATSGLKLADLAARLAGGRGREDPEDAGELDMFGAF